MDNFHANAGGIKCRSQEQRSPSVCRAPHFPIDRQKHTEARYFFLVHPLGRRTADARYNKDCSQSRHKNGETARYWLCVHLYFYLVPG
jgi:hypothetical protein